MAEESGRPGTLRSNVGCDAIEDPCTKRIVPAGVVPAAGFLFQRKSLTSPFFVQCSVPPVHSTAMRFSMWDTFFPVRGDSPMIRRAHPGRSAPTQDYGSADCKSQRCSPQSTLLAHPQCPITRPSCPECSRGEEEVARRGARVAG